MGIISDKAIKEELERFALLSQAIEFIAKMTNDTKDDVILYLHKKLMHNFETWDDYTEVFIQSEGVFISAYDFIEVIRPDGRLLGFDELNQDDCFKSSYIEVDKFFNKDLSESLGIDFRSLIFHEESIANIEENDALDFFNEKIAIAEKDLEELNVNYDELYEEYKKIDIEYDELLSLSPDTTNLKDYVKHLEQKNECLEEEVLSLQSKQSPPTERTEKSYLTTIGLLLELLQTPKGFNDTPPYQSQALIITAIEDKGIYGHTKSTLESRFSQANNALEDAEKKR